MRVASPRIARTKEINWDLLHGILRCPLCEHAPLELHSVNVACSACGRDYPIEDGVIDFLVGNELPVPRFYTNPQYQRFMQRQYTMHASHYAPDSISGRVERAIKKDLFRLVDSKEGPSADLGCGLGEGFRLIGADDQVIGVDASLPLLKQTKRTHPEASILRAELARLPFRDGSLRRVFAIGVLEHVFHLERSLEQVQRCLATTGRFYVAVPTEGSLAVATARFVTSRRNARICEMTPAESRIAQRIDHCNTVYSLDTNLRKFFSIEAQSFWPFKVRSAHINLSKSFRLRHLPET